MPLPAPYSGFASRWRVAGLAFALFAVVAGTRWATIDRFGSDLPAADQWDAEAVQTLLPWFDGDHFLGHLFQPHNEHRLVLTKLQSLAVVCLSGQWDARLQSVLNAVLAALLLSAFWLFARRTAGRAGEIALLLLTAVLFGLPLAWENILGGFHSQQWWLLGLSGIAIIQLPFARPWTRGWFIGATAALLALGAMGSGFVAAAVVAAVAWERWRSGQAAGRDALPTLVVAVLIVGAGLVLRVDFAPHAPLKAQSPGEFFTHLIRSLQWPLRSQAWAGALLWLPWWIVLIGAVRRPGGNSSRQVEHTIVALGIWVWLQMIATAYLRGAGADYPAPRYVDTLACGLLVNGWALTVLLGSAANAATSPAGRRRGRALVAAAWLVTLGVGLGLATQRVLRTELPAARSFARAAEDHLRGYLASNDAAELASEEIPFPSPEGLVWRLEHKALRDRMPVSVRAPLPLAAGVDSAAVFQRNLVAQRQLPGGSHQGLSPATPAYGAHPTWGSYGPDGVAATGLWISAPVQAPAGGWLKFETAGQLGEPGLALELHDAQTGVLLGVVRPSRVPGDSWRAAYVRAPSRPFVVVARDADRTRWFAFSAPVEMSAASHAAWQLAKNGLLVATSGAALGLFLLLVFASTPTTTASAGHPAN